MKQLIRHIIVTSMPYKLTHFLIKEKCYSQFISNTINYVIKWSIHPTHMVRFLQSENAISHSFTWHHTVENFLYWENIQRKYKLFIKNHE